MSEKFQAVVIGGGPGGYVCAIRLAQLGLKTACIDSRGTLGGTCLNIGCIPSKSLLNLSEKFSKAKNFSNLGIEVSDVKLNLEKMMQNKEKAVSVLTKGVEFLFKKNKITYFKGVGSFKSANKISILDNKKVESILEVSTFINTSTSENIKFVILRKDQEVSLIVKPKLVQSKDSLGNSVKKRMIGIKLFPDPNTNANFKKILITVGFAHAPGLFRFFVFMPSLVVPIVFLTQFWIFASLIIGVRETLNFKSNFKSAGVIIIAFLIISIVSLSFVMDKINTMSIN